MELCDPRKVKPIPTTILFEEPQSAKKLKEKEDEVKKYIAVTYIHCEGAMRKSTVWEIPSQYPLDPPFKELYDHFGNERSKKQRNWDEARPEDKDELNNPYAFLYSVNGSNREDFDLAAMQFFKQLQPPYILNGRIVFVQVADGE